MGDLCTELPHCAQRTEWKNDIFSPTHTVWKNDKFSLTKKTFRQINSLVTYLVKPLLSRNFGKNA